MEYPLTERQRELRDLARSLAQEHLRPRAAEIDREGRFPFDNFAALGRAGLMGLTITPEYGGLGADFLSVVLVVEELAKECPSTAMCYKMHLEALNPFAHLATPEQGERLLRPIARGELLMAVAGNEGYGQGVIRSVARPADGGYLLENASKSFVTSSHAADLFCIFAVLEPGAPTSVFVARRTELICEVEGRWDGLGMRGNDSCPMTLSGFLSASSLVGELGGMGQVRRFHTPLVYLSYAAVYLGLAEGAFDEARRHVLARTYGEGGPSPARFETVQRYFGEMRVSLDRTQGLVYAAAVAADAGMTGDQSPFQSASIAADETALEVTHTAMVVGGGISFAKRNALERYLRDARAGVIMVPADDVVKLTLGRAVLGLAPA
ncbi:MAG: acyl-CoA/acyl-ACP dehydrogenase [Chloroflexi bacterium]|nr:acyl-CoA/acyl-ACP dehydrogenase [Chloroflexota bacterium]